MAELHQFFEIPALIPSPPNPPSPTIVTTNAMTIQAEEDISQMTCMTNYLMQMEVLCAMECHDDGRKREQRRTDCGKKQLCLQGRYVVHTGFSIHTILQGRRVEELLTI